MVECATDGVRKDPEREPRAVSEKYGYGNLNQYGDGHLNRHTPIVAHQLFDFGIFL